MPSRVLHAQQLARNNAVLAQLLAKDDDGSRQWAVVVAFYAALHAIEAWFADQNKHHFRHEDRRQALAMSGVPVGIYTAYMTLENEARNARYNIHLFDKTKIEQMIREYLRRIEKHAGF